MTLGQCIDNFAGVPLSHLNLTTSMKNVSNTYKLTSNDRTLLVMPLFHIHGLVCGLLATLSTGGSAVIPQRFSASHFWADYTDMKCNWYTAGNTNIILFEAIETHRNFLLQF